MRTDTEDRLIRKALQLFSKAPTLGPHIVKEQLYGFIHATNCAHLYEAYDDVYEIWNASLNLDMERI